MADRDLEKIKEMSAPAMYAMRCAVFAGALLLTVKGIAFFATGSVSVLGSFLDSLSDTGISAIMLLGLHLSLKPADESHRYGHGKAEALSALLQALVLSIAAILLVFKAFHQIVHPEPIAAHGLGIGIIIFSLIVTFILVRIQNNAIAKSDSLSVKADQRHYLSDFFINIGIVIALTIQYFGGPIWVDGVMGLLVAGYLFHSAYETGHEATDMLMDRELSDDIRNQIREIVLRHPDILDMHDLRTHRSGMITYISFDVEMEPDMKLQQAHDATRSAEKALLEVFPNADIFIHIDPKGDIIDARHRVPGVHY